MGRTKKAKREIVRTHFDLQPRISELLTELANDHFRGIKVHAVEAAIEKMSNYTKKYKS